MHQCEPDQIHASESPGGTQAIGKSPFTRSFTSVTRLPRAASRRLSRVSMARGCPPVRQPPRIICLPTAIYVTHSRAILPRLSQTTSETRPGRILKDRGISHQEQNTPPGFRANGPFVTRVSIASQIVHVRPS